MKFMFLLYGDETAEAELTAEQSREIMAGYGALTEKLGDRRLHGAALAGSDTVTVVRPREMAGGEVEFAVTDGPFAEGREQVGGYYVIDCADLDEALHWAKQIPRSPGLAVAIHPLLDV